MRPIPSHYIRKIGTDSNPGSRRNWPYWGPVARFDHCAGNGHASSFRIRLAGLKVQRGQKYSSAGANRYYTDEHGVSALGLHLIAGRWITALQVRGIRLNDSCATFATVPIVPSGTPAAFHGDALGQIVYFVLNSCSDRGCRRARAGRPYVGYHDDNSTFEPVQHSWTTSLSASCERDPVSRRRSCGPHRRSFTSSPSSGGSSRTCGRFPPSAVRAFQEERVNTVMLAAVMWIDASRHRGPSD